MAELIGRRDEFDFQRRRTPLIVIVEDSPTQATQLKFLLQEEGFQVIVVADGATALEVIRERPPDLVVSDVIMPGMSGYELCRAIKADAALRETPVILVTSLSTPHDVFHGLDAGADNFIMKPYEGRYLIARVDYLLRNRELRGRGKLQIGVEIDLGGQRHFITAERQQILDLLISTYEEAVRLHDNLVQREQSLQRSYDSLNSLYVLAKTLNGCRTRAEVVEQALSRIDSLANARTAWIHVVEDGAFRTFVASNAPPSLREAVQMGEPCSCKQRLSERSPTDPTIMPGCELPAADAGAASSFSVPLYSGDELLGVLNLVAASRADFSQEEHQTLAAAAEQIASALDRARLYEGLEQKVAERTEELEREVAVRRSAQEALELRARQQTRLAEIGQYALREPALEKLLARASEDLAAELGADCVGIYRFDEADGRLRLAAGLGWKPGYIGDTFLDADRASLGDSVVSRQHTIIVDDWQTEKRFPLTPVLAAHGIRSSMGTAIEDRGTSFGIVGVHSRTPNRFSEDDAVFLWTVVNTLANAVKLRTANESLALSEARFRDFAHCTADWFWETDANQRFTFVSESGTLHDRNGSDPFQVVGMLRSDQAKYFNADPDPTPTIQASIDRLEPFENLEMRCRLPDGANVWLNISGLPVVDSSGKLVVVRGVASEITDRKRAEIALRSSVERFELVARATSSGIWDWDIATGRTFYTARFLELLGHQTLSRDDFAFLEESLHPEDRARARASIDAHLRERRPFAQECRLRTANGGYRWFHMMGEAVWNQEGRPVRMCGSIVDVTDRRLAEEHLRQAQKMDAIGTLTGGIAHDFNNMLTIMLGSLDLLSRRVSDDALSQDLVRDATLAADRSATLTRQLLAFSRRQPLEPQRLKINDLILQTHNLLERVLGRATTIQLDLSDNVWPVFIDPAQFDTVLVNLAVNARDAMPDGGTLTIETANAELDKDYTARWADVEPGDYVQITVSDSGSGIPAHIVERIFEPFFTTKDVGKGTGLGLAMMFGFIKQSQGHVAVYSEVGIGTTVRLYLPRDTAPGAALPETASDFPHARPGEAVLVVDDEEMVRKIALGQLESIGYDVLQANGPAQALQVLAENDRIDLLLSDVIMPGPMNGYELAAIAQQRYPRLKVLLASGFADGALRQSLPDRSELEVIGKPFSKRELARRVRATLDA